MLCPVVFEPLFMQRIWGGRRLESLFGKALPADVPIGESWELVDLPDYQSVATSEPVRGKTISELIAEWGDDLIASASLHQGRFPLMVKFLDARDVLSVQVHPDEQAAEKLGDQAVAKHEAWYIMEADEDAVIYRDFIEDTTRRKLLRALKDGKVDRLLKKIPVSPGQCYYLPAGTVHALGAGVVLAEVQTPSDTTYRLFDWNRTDDGQPRELHVEQALECVNYQPVNPAHERRSHHAQLFDRITRLVTSPHFTISQLHVIEGGDREFDIAAATVWIIQAGAGSIVYGDGRTQAIRAGDVVLLPAALGHINLAVDRDLEWLQVHLPAASS